VHNKRSALRRIHGWPMVLIRKTAAVMIRRVTASPDRPYTSSAGFGQRCARSEAMARAYLSGQHAMAGSAVQQPVGWVRREAA